MCFVVFKIRDVYDVQTILSRPEKNTTTKTLGPTTSKEGLWRTVVVPTLPSLTIYYRTTGTLRGRSSLHVGRGVSDNQS